MVHPRMHNASPQFERLLESCLHTSDRLTNAVSVGSISKKKMSRQYPLTVFWIEAANTCRHLTLMDIAEQVDDCIQEQLLAEHLGLDEK